MNLQEFVEDRSKNLSNQKTFIPILKSRYTPNLENGKCVAFQKGDEVTYKCDGTKITCTIVSDLMINRGHVGYEAIFHDDYESYFAIAENIVDWEGKC